MWRMANYGEDIIFVPWKQGDKAGTSEAQAGITGHSGEVWESGILPIYYG